MILKRKRNGKTNYKKRLSLLKSDQLRLVVRKTNSQVILQLVEYHPKGDIILTGFNSSVLIKQGWKGSTNNLSGAYFSGFILGKSMKGKKAILDIGLQKPHKQGKIYAAVKGAIDGGLLMNVPKEIFPNQERLDGSNVKNKENIVMMKKKLK